MMKMIWFDMDGTLADFYGVENWLDYLLNSDTTPYRIARGLGNLSLIARYLNKLQRIGWSIGIISWTSKSGGELYNELVAIEKLHWLKTHMASVNWDNIKIVPYGTDKKATCEHGILFDDEEGNRNNWGENAHTPAEIISVLSALLQG